MLSRWSMSPEIHLVPGRIARGTLVFQFRRIHMLRVTGFLSLLLAFSTAIQAQSNVCDLAARIAASESGVPPSVLLSITRTETGRNVEGRLEPWPWAVNMEGHGRWFDSKDAALAYVFKAYKRGARSFDIGCFQINYRWHGANFQSIEDMFDPQKNANYAAAFLNRLYQESRSWNIAAGHYHSRSPKLAERYRKRFQGILANSSPNTLPKPRSRQSTSVSAARNVQNSFPLLTQSSDTRAIASLVPLGRHVGKFVDLSKERTGY